MALGLKNISGPTGTTQNVGGVTGRFRFFAIDSALSIAKKKEMDDAVPPTDNDELVNITGNHTFTSPAGMYESYITRDSGSVKFKGNDARDTSGCEVTFEGMIPGAEADVDGTLTLASNTKLIGFAELADKKWVQIGSEAFPAELKYEWQSGKNTGEGRGWKVVMSGFETTKQYYKGTFTMA